MNEVLLMAILTETKKATIQDVNKDTVLSCHEPHWNKESNHQIVKPRQEDGEVLPKKSVTPDGRPMICQEDNIWVRSCQDQVTPIEQVFQVSMDTVLSCHEPHWNKENNHQIVKLRTRKWWGLAKEISDARWETNGLSRRQLVTKFKGDIDHSHSGSRGETVILSRMTWLQKQCCVKGHCCKRSCDNMTLYYQVTFSKKP